MLLPSIPENEEKRLATLHALHILDTPREERYDRISRLAQSFFHVPIAGITLIDRERSWYKSLEGFTAYEISRDISFCTHTILQKEVFIIPDATLDPRFVSNSFVTGEPYVRFYAGFPLFALNGDVLGAFCIVDMQPHNLSTNEIQALRDMSAWAEQEINTERISKAFIEQRESEARIRAVMESSSEAMLFSSPQRKVLFVNKRYCEFFGRSRETVLNSSKEDNIQHFIDYAFADPVQVRALSTDILEDTQLRRSAFIEQKKPQQRTLEVFSTPVHDGEKHLGRLLVFRDVTREQEVSHQKNEFVAHVSHELRTPLTAIKGYIDLFVENNIGPLNPLQHDLMKVIQDNTDRLVTLVNDMLDISRIDANQTTLQRKMTDVSHVIRDVATLLQPQLNTKKQILTLALSEALPSIMGDTNRLTQVFTNLLHNAHQYTPEGGSISITTTNSADFVTITVQDTGIGLSIEDQANLFQRFFRSQNEVTQRISGTGLGLAITRSIVELHQGNITVSSSLGFGSAFTINLPTIDYMKRTRGVKKQAEALAC